jgi:GTPase SAR1 family protein
MTMIIKYTLIVTVIAAGIYSLIFSLIGFKKAIWTNRNPYKNYVDRGRNSALGNKNYFFGPGYSQVFNIMKDTFVNLKHHLQTLERWRNRKIGKKWYVTAVVNIFYLLAMISTMVLGMVWVAGFSIALMGLLIIGMCVFFVFFSTLWLLDRTTLILNALDGRCASCKQTTICPLYLCEGCNTWHAKLTPGKYGLFHRRCSCGKRLPTTIFNGRSKLHAKCRCGCEFPVGISRNFGVQLVGGSNAGKSTFLATFWNIYLQRYTSANIEKYPKNAFDELDRWVKTGQQSAITTAFNANMYSVVHRRKMRLPYQFTIYDIAGEAFVQGGNIQQQQYKYSERVILAIDPTAKPQVAYDSFVGFINEMKSLQGVSATKILSKPVAVIITKADMFMAELGKKPADDIARNQNCRNFLEKNHFGNVLNLLEGVFSNIEFFAVSAVGHVPTPGKPYKPFGVHTVEKWIYESAAAELRRQAIKRTIKKILLYGIVVLAILYAIYILMDGMTP